MLIPCCCHGDRSDANVLYDRDRSDANVLFGCKCVGGHPLLKLFFSFLSRFMQKYDFLNGTGDRK